MFKWLKNFFVNQDIDKINDDLDSIEDKIEALEARMEAFKVEMYTYVSETLQPLSRRISRSLSKKDLYSSEDIQENKEKPSGMKLGFKRRF